MRIATWNVNSLKARMEAVEKWLGRAQPDVLLMQETKLADDDAPTMPFAMMGYQLVHHGEGRWNGVAVALREGLTAKDVIANFDGRPVRDSSAGSSREFGEEDFDPFDEARMLAVTIDGDEAGPLTVAAVYAPNGRVVDSPFYAGKLAWFERLRRWLAETRDPGEALLIGGDFNVAPSDEDVWDPRRVHGGTHVSERERRAVAALREWGLTDAYRGLRGEPGRFSWWDYRAGMFHRNEGMRIDLLYATAPVASRAVWAEIDREARKGPPTPSDHAPVVLDLDRPGVPFDAGWEGALARIRARTRPR